MVSTGVVKRRITQHRLLEPSVADDVSAVLSGVAGRSLGLVMTRHNMSFC